MQDIGGRWNLSPIDLRTNRLRIRRFGEADICPRYLGWLNDATHMRYSNQRFFSHSESSAREFLASFALSESQFLALESDEGLVGTSTVHLSTHHGVADIGILIGVPYVGRGLGREAIGALAVELIRQGIRKVTIGTSSANFGMQNLLNGLHFIPDGRRPRQEIVDGAEADLVYFARFSPPQLTD